MENPKEFINPIDKDKITETPHTLPYAHHAGSAVVKPIDLGRLKGTAVTVMYEQTDMQLAQIRQQIELLAQQAKAISLRVEISERIYRCEINFPPVVGKTYHLYRRSNGTETLSMIAPEEWRRGSPFEFVATARLLADHTWEVVNAA